MITFFIILPIYSLIYTYSYNYLYKHIYIHIHTEKCLEWFSPNVNDGHFKMVGLGDCSVFQAFEYILILWIFFLVFITQDDNNNNNNKKLKIPLFLNFCLKYSFISRGKAQKTWILNVLVKTSKYFGSLWKCVSKY